jgi:hypothetical protein
VVVDGGDEQARPLRGPVDLEDARVVVRQQGDDVAAAQAVLVQRARQPDRPVLQLAVRQALAGLGHDHGRAVGVGRGERAGIHRRLLHVDRAVE